MRLALTFRAGSSYRHNKIPSPRVGEIALGFFGVGPLYILREIQNSDLGQTIGSENIFWVILVSELRSRALREAFRTNFSSRIQPWASKNPISQGWGDSPRIFWVGPLYIRREIQNSDLGQTIGSENIFWVILVSELRSRALREAFRTNFSSRIQPWASKNPISQGWGNSPRIFWGGPPLAALLAAGWPEKGLLH